MTRKRVYYLLQRYLKGKASANEQQIVDDWYQQLDSSVSKPHNDEGIPEAAERIWQQISQDLFEEKPKAKFITSKKTVRWSIAASIIFVAGISYFVWQQPITEKQQLSDSFTTTIQKTDKQIKNDSGVKKNVTLEDGTVVTLEPKASITYPVHFAKDNRTIILSGDAFFDVTENPDRPFLVNTGGVTTKVLGTSFFIRMSEDYQDIEVSVKTGKVSVYETKINQVVNKNLKIEDANGVILLPNQKVNYSKKSQVFITHLIEKPLIIDSEIPVVKNNFNYSDTPLNEVLRDLEQIYGVDIEVERMSVKQCPLTAQLTMDDLFVNLEIICAAIGGTFEVQGTKILISGNGCN